MKRYVGIANLCEIMRIVDLGAGSKDHLRCFANTSAVAKDKVANMLLAVKGRNGGGSCKKVAQDLSRDAAREQLRPLLETACARLVSVLHRSFDIAVDQEQTTTSEPLHLVTGLGLLSIATVPGDNKQFPLQ